MSLYRSRHATRKLNPLWGFFQLCVIVFVLMGVAFLFIPSN